MVTFFAKEKQNTLSYTLAWRLGCAGTSSLTDLPPKLSERETATKKATANQWSPRLLDLFDSDQSTALGAIGPLQIDVTVTAKWPLWVLHNVGYTQSFSKKFGAIFFLVLVLVFENGFF